jgi:hypothetical protein
MHRSRTNADDSNRSRIIINIHKYAPISIPLSQYTIAALLTVRGHSRHNKLPLRLVLRAPSCRPSLNPPTPILSLSLCFTSIRIPVSMRIAVPRYMLLLCLASKHLLRALVGCPSNPHCCLIAVSSLPHRCLIAVSSLSHRCLTVSLSKCNGLCYCASPWNTPCALS